METYKFNNTVLTEETINKTDKHFADICQECIDAVLNGEVRVNDPKKYIKDKCDRKKAYLTGNINRWNLTYLQRAYFIQTGESIALLP